MLKKNLKAFVAMAAIAAMVVTGVTPVDAFTSKNDDVNTEATTKPLRSVMYYGDWSIWGGEGEFMPQQMAVENLTHLNFAFMDFDEQGNFKFCDPTASLGHPLKYKELPYDETNGYTGGVLNEFQVLRQKNPNLRIGLSLGGWSKSGDFSVMAANSSSRAKFVQNAMDFIKYMNMDFVDIDWEYPGANQKRDPDLLDNKNDEGTPKATAADKGNYILLLQDLRNALDKQGKELGKTYELSVALPIANSKVDDGIDVAKMFNIVDFANLMTYDAAGAWDNVSGHQSALYTNPNSPYAGKGFSVDESVNNYISKGAKPEKIVIGAAYYTRGWEKVSNNGPDKSLPGLYGQADPFAGSNAGGSKTSGAKNFAPMKEGDGGRAGGVWPWRAQADLKVAYQGLKEYWDDTAKAPYLYNESTGAFFTYDNERSIQEKCNYIKQKGLGGMIAWMASQDADTGSGKRDQLTKATKQGLFGTAPLPTYKINETKTDAKATLTSVAEAWGTGSEITVKIDNNGRVTSTDPAVKRAEGSNEAIKFPKIYIKTNGLVLTAGEGCPTVTKEGEFYVMDLSAVYDAKVIAPDAKGYTFKVKSDKKITSVDESIASVEVSQRMHLSSGEFGRTTIFTGKGKIYAAEDVNQDDVIDIVDLSAVAARYNAKKGEANFAELCDVNKDAIIDIYDLTRVGAKMGSGIVDPPTPSDAWDITKGYNAGEIVSYKGKKYRAKWYSKGEEPGQPWNAWEEVK